MLITEGTPCNIIFDKHLGIFVGFKNEQEFCVIHYF